MHILLLIAIAWCFYADYQAGKRRVEQLRKDAEQQQARFNNRLDLNRMDKF